jgi:hypothetical protein
MEWFWMHWKKGCTERTIKAHGRWIKELPAMVWGLWTQPSRNTGVSPYFMVYGAEAVLPTDIELWSPRVENYNKDQVTEQWELEVNSIEERRLDSCIHMAKYLTVLWRYYNKNVQKRFFVVGDMLLKWKTSQDGVHKLAIPWKGPYIVKAITRPTSYRLARLDGTDVPNSVRIDKLRRFYP